MEFITLFLRVPLHFNLNLPLKLQPAAKELKWLQWSQCIGLAIEYQGLLLQTTTGKIVPVPGSAPPGWTVAGQAVSDCTYTQIGKPLRRQTQRCTPGMQHKSVLLVLCVLTLEETL